ncbi:MAG: energy-coupling factor transporter ATP-binding protein EcfA2 [Roseivirga sp.]
MVDFVNFPKSTDSKTKIDFPVSSSVVITGANGSGKTRLGVWMEFEGSQNKIVRRISAQKSLTMPDFSHTSSMDEAEADLEFGVNNVEQTKANPTHFKTYNRWGNKPSTFLLNDYEKLMVYLFTEFFQKTIDHSEGKTTENEAIIYKIKRIWELVLPHRELIIEAGKVKTNIKGDSETSYNASNMSDGERVIFYLIGQCLTANKSSILVIDEPELHLHKSIHSKLWSILEIERKDCLFVYITHDLDFAAQKSSAEKIWIKSYDGHDWVWEVLPEFGELPEELVLEVLGARTPVIFVEGTANSFDLQLYSLFYSDYLVIPKGSCENVIQVVKGLNESGIVSEKKIVGIIDRDRRVQAEIDNLKRNNVLVLDVAEVENLFILPEIIKVACESLEFNYGEKQSEITEKVIDTLKNELDVQISKRASGEVVHKLRSFNDKSNGIEKIKSSYTAVVNNIDIESIYADVAKEFNVVISDNDYLGALRLYNRKALLTSVGEVLGLKKGEYVSLILRLSKGRKRDDIVSVLRNHLPELG